MECGNYIEIHKNKSGTIGYCFGCDSFHLTIKGVLTIINHNQLSNVLRNLNQMKTDLISSHSEETIQAGVQIKLSSNIYLCLNFNEIENSIELIEIGSYMQHIQEIVNS